MSRQQRKSYQDQDRKARSDNRRRVQLNRSSGDIIYHFDYNISMTKAFAKMRVLGFYKNLYEYVDTSRSQNVDGLFILTEQEMKCIMARRKVAVRTHTDAKAYLIGILAYVILILHPASYKDRFIKRIMNGLAVDHDDFFYALNLMRVRQVGKFSRIIDGVKARRLLLTLPDCPEGFEVINTFMRTKKILGNFDWGDLEQWPDELLDYLWLDYQVLIRLEEDTSTEASPD